MSIAANSPYLNRLLIGLLVVAMATLPVRSQDATDIVPVPMSAQERSVVLVMCDAATWASKRQFDGVCEFFRTKFETAVRDAKAKADSDKAAQPAPADQPKE